MDKTPDSISVQEFAIWRGEGRDAVLVDVRDPWELEICAVEGALSIPLQQLPARLAELPTDRPIVLMCHHGMRSENARNWLRHNGLSNAINLEGGINEWAQKIDKTMGQY